LQAIGGISYAGSTPTLLIKVNKLL